MLRVSTAGNFLTMNLTADSRFLSIRYEGLALGSPHAWKRKKNIGEDRNIQNVIASNELPGEMRDSEVQ